MRQTSGTKQRAVTREECQCRLEDGVRASSSVLRAWRFRCQQQPPEHPPSGPAVIRSRATAGSQDRVRWRPYPPHHSTPRSPVREFVRRMDRSATYGRPDTECDSIQPCCLTPRGGSWPIRASTSPLAVESWVQPRGQARRAATRAAACLPSRVLSRWVGPERSHRILLRTEHPLLSERSDCPRSPGRWRVELSALTELTGGGGAHFGNTEEPVELLRCRDRRNQRID